MKILITGASGFVGRNFIDRLKSVSDFEVFVLSLHASKFDKDLQSNFKFIQLNRSFSNVQLVVSEIKPEVLIHLGWQGIPDYSVENSFDSFKWSVEITQCAINAGVRRVISTGSCWEYLDPKGAIDEQWPVDRVNAFKLAKSSTREFLSLMCKEAEVEFVWLRLFYVYGRYQNQHSLIPSLLEQLRKNIAPFANNPDPTIDFVNASYVAEILLECIQKQQISGVFNLGSGIATNVLEIVNTLRFNHGYPILKIETNPNALKFYSSNDKINKITNIKASNILNELK